MHNIPNADLDDAQRWAEEAAADEEAELTYRRMLEDEEHRAEQAAAALEAERHSHIRVVVDTDLF